MIPMVIPRLLSIMPRAEKVAYQFIGPLNDSLVKYKIINDHNVCAFLAQAAHESNELRALEENLLYTHPERICAIWPKRFTPQLAQECASKPERIANIAYASRMGNGPLESGDGWRYRGRGIFQLTGKANYVKCEMETGIKCVDEPELLTSPTYACESAAWFWCDRGLNSVLSFEEITRRINGPAMEGLAQRVMYLRRAEALLLR